MGHLSRILASLFLVCGVVGCSDEDIAPRTGPTTFGPLGDRADLPVGERIAIDRLAGPVDVVRDEFGRPHIYATSAADAIRVEGYLIARERTLQLELLRRVAEGRLAALLGQSDESLIDVDIGFRHIGLARVAKSQYDALPMDGEIRVLLDAYADGVSQLFAKIRSGEQRLPDGIFGIDVAAFTPWTGIDSLAIGRLETYLLSYDGDLDLQTDDVLARARATFSATDPDPAMARRAGIERDMLRFAPADPATTTAGYPASKPASAQVRTPQPAESRVRLMEGVGGRSPLTLRPRRPALDGYLRAIRRVRNLLAPDGFGSNDWAVAPARSATGNPLVASDPHLSLTAPAIFWPVSIDVHAAAKPEENLALGGIAFPGLPGIILGHNANVAWGATVAGYDVTDAYAEELTPDGKAVVFQGKEVPIELVPEVIEIQGSAPYTYDVAVVPHHGPIVPQITTAHTVMPPDPDKGAISIRWTGLEPTDEVGAVFGLLRANTADDAHAALDHFGVGAQNWMIGDTSGNILWTSHANVPVRDTRAFAWDAATYQGQLPCFVLPGDGSAEWQGFLPGELVPWETNPLAGYLATANNDPLGDTLDNDPSNDTLPDGTPMYLACSYDIGFREGRIRTRLDSSHEPLTPDDLAAIQGDARSAMGSRLAPLLADAIDAAEDERKKPGTHPSLAGVVADAAYDAERMVAVKDLLTGWADLGFEAAAGIDLETNAPLPVDDPDAKASQATLIFDTWLTRVLPRTFGDELARMGGVTLDRERAAKFFLRLALADPPTLATYDPQTHDSSVWDDLETPELETRHERMMRALLDALGWLETTVGPDLATYRWGALHTVRFDALIPVFGELSIPPTADATFPDGFPRHGDNFAVDSSDFDIGLAPGAPPSFSYMHGPTQRFVVDLDPAGPKAWNALPGGNVWDKDSPHFRDEAELWRKNQTHAVPFLLGDVVQAFESRTVFE